MKKAHTAIEELQNRSYHGTVRKARRKGGDEKIEWFENWPRKENRHITANVNARMAHLGETTVGGGGGVNAAHEREFQKKAGKGRKADGGRPPRTYSRTRTASRRCGRSDRKGVSGYY